MSQLKVANSKKQVAMVFSKKEWNNLFKIGSQELKINGKMFDLSSMYSDGINYFISGNFDSKEDFLLENASNDVDEKSNLKKNSFSQNLLFFEEIHSFKLCQFVDLETKTGTKHVRIFSQSIQSESPPPKYSI